MENGDKIRPVKVRIESDWTPETLKEYLDLKIADLEQLVDQRQSDVDKALDAALKSMDARLEGMNEFRQTLADQRLNDEKHRTSVEATFLTKEVYALEHRNLENIVSKNYDAAMLATEKNTTRIVEIDKKLFAVSELKADKREGLSSNYYISGIMFGAMSFIIALGMAAWTLLHH